jgi:hypothetical protein
MWGVWILALLSPTTQGEVTWEALAFQPLLTFLRIQLFVNKSVNPSLDIYWEPTMYKAQGSCDGLHQ